jgi:hypothetical protein
MKLLCPILLLLFPYIAVAQDKSINSSSPNLIVIKHKLGSIIRVNVSARDQPPDIDKSPHLEINPPRYEWRAKAQLQVQNAGSKNIRSIDWRLLLIVEENSTKQIKSYFTHSNKLLRPGQIAKLERSISDQSLKTLKKQRDKGMTTEHAVVTRIEYSDGAIWQGEN